jgi:cell division protein FtsB
MRRVKHKYAPTWLLSKWFLIVVGVLLTLLSVSLIREFYRSYQINNEIALLQQDIEQLQGENTELTEFVEYLKTDRYFQEQARLKFGLKTPGEKVVVLKGDTKADSVEDFTSVSSQESSKKQKTNPSRWFAYFFESK